MLYLSILVSLLALNGVFCAEYEKKGHILMLTDENFEEAIKEHEHILIMVCNHHK